MSYASSIVHFVTDAQKTSALLCDHFGFVVEENGQYGVVINNGALSIRFIKSKEASAFITLDYYTQNLEQSISEFSKLGFRAKGNIQEVSIYRHQILLTTDLGFNILLYTTLNEDDLGLDIELPISLDWENDAVQIIQLLLKDIPIEFRAQARTKAVQQAESIAIVAGETTVDQQRALQGFMDATPPFKTDKLIERLKALHMDTSFLIL